MPRLKPRMKALRLEPCVIGQRLTPSLLELRNKESGIAENTPR
jgi:hypothetical protein